MLFSSLKNPTGEQYDLGGECLLPNGILAQVLKPVPVPKSHKTERILHLGGSPIAIRQGKLAMDWKQITNSSYAFFSSCLFLCPLKAALHVLFPRRSIWFLLSPLYRLFHSLQNASLPSPHCSTLSREVWLCYLALHPAFPTVPAWVSCWASYTALQWWIISSLLSPLTCQFFFFFIPKTCINHL